MALERRSRRAQREPSCDLFCAYVVDRLDTVEVVSTELEGEMLCSDADVEVRLCAVEALVAIGDKSATRLIRGVLADIPWRKRRKPAGSGCLNAQTGSATYGGLGRARLPAPVCGNVP